MKNRFLAGPYLIWMALFTIIPLVIVLYFALTDSVTGRFTLANIVQMKDYLPIFLRSIWLAAISSVICLILGYPVAWCIAQTGPKTQRFLYMLVMLPMCISFLLRTLAWVAMLEDTGMINTALSYLHIGPLYCLLHVVPVGVGQDLLHTLGIPIGGLYLCKSCFSFL